MATAKSTTNPQPAQTGILRPGEIDPESIKPLGHPTVPPVRPTAYGERKG